MYMGQLVESAPNLELFSNPKHPYTKGLLSCVHNPTKNEKLHPIPGSPPDLLKPPAGCPFVDRCDDAMRICKSYEAQTINFNEGHSCSCWLYYDRNNDGAKLSEEVYNG